MAKKLTVKRVLETLPKDDKISVQLYAYGITFANTWTDGMKTVGECLDRMNSDCLNAGVVYIRANWVKENVEDERYYIPVIGAEIVYNYN